MNELKKIVADTLGVAEHLVHDNASAESLSEWDSVAHLNIILSIEGAYGVSFEPDEVMEMTSLPSICRVLSKRGVQIA